MSSDRPTWLAFLTSLSTGVELGNRSLPIQCLLNNGRVTSEKTAPSWALSDLVSGCFPVEEDSLSSGCYPDPHCQSQFFTNGQPRGIRCQSTRNVKRGMVGTVSSYLWGNLWQLSSGKSDSCLYSVDPPPIFIPSV